MTDKALVAIDRKGKVAMTFNSIKDAVSFMETTRWKLVYPMRMGREAFGFLWMEKKAYDALTKKEKASLARTKRKRRKYTEKEKERRKENNDRKRIYAKEVFARSFMDFAKHHVNWLCELKDKWLNRGDFGIRPELLADFYTEKRDKEIALIVSLFIPEGEKCLERVQQARKLLGDSPWEWFKNREFSGNDAARRFSRRLFRHLNEWWLECFSYGSYDSIEDFAKKTCTENLFSYLDFLERVVNVGKWSPSRLRIAVVLLVLSHADGFGQGVWDIGRKDVTIPVQDDFCVFLKMWMPDFSRYGSPNDCVALFGMDSVDFYYAFLAYEDLKRVRPKACSRYSTLYLCAYKTRPIYASTHWVNIFPEIDFDSVESFVDEL